MLADILFGGLRNTLYYKDFAELIKMTYKLYEPLLERIRGPVICAIDGEETEYNGAQALIGKTFEKRYRISEIFARGGKTVISLQEDTAVINDLNEGWAKQHKQETGEDISFF